MPDIIDDPGEPLSVGGALHEPPLFARILDILDFDARLCRLERFVSDIEGPGSLP
jgi:hypothetical protein